MPRACCIHEWNTVPGCSNRYSTTCVCPEPAAYINGTHPKQFLILTSIPCTEIKDISIYDYRVEIKPPLDTNSASKITRKTTSIYTQEEGKNIEKERERKIRERERECVCEREIETEIPRSKIPINRLICVMEDHSQISRG